MSKNEKQWDLTKAGQDCNKEVTLNTVHLAVGAPMPAAFCPQLKL